MGSLVDFYEVIRSYFVKVDEVAKEKFTAQLDKNTKKDWIWRIVAANGNKVAIGGEGYKNRGECIKMLELAMVGFGVKSYTDFTTAVKISKAKGK